MRLKEITLLKNRYTSQVQNIQSLVQSSTNRFQLYPPPGFKEKNLLSLSAPVLSILSPWFCSRAKIKKYHPAQQLCIGERFSKAAHQGKLLKIIKTLTHAELKLCVVGCGVVGKDVQFWVHQGIKNITGIDIYPKQQAWKQAAEQLHQAYKVKTDFIQASVENIPRSDGSFDIVYSDAVLEHVRNVEKAFIEAHRVLSMGGIVAHQLGPLYYSYSGDHCINAYGFEAGYDHLLLEEIPYRRKINDKEFFDKNAADPQCNFWARTDQFSFLTTKEYIEIFQKHFSIQHLLLKVSEEGLCYKKQFPGQWGKLLHSGIAEEDLLISGIGVILRKR